MKAVQITGWCARFIREQVQPGDICIDATMGNGNDTLLLSSLCGKDGHVFAFDIQEEALINTRKRLMEADAPQNYTLLLESHTNIEHYVDPGTVSCITFNLGYLPGGDPKGNGTGGSGETIKGEFSSNGVKNDISHVRGTISMARSTDPDSASSQFFIVQSDSTFLDGDYAAFGKVTEGMDIVDEICKNANPTDDNGTIKADEQPVIDSIQITD